jgi:hypothetical protein
MAVRQYDTEGYMEPEEKERQDALGAELLAAWRPVLTGAKKQSRQAARVDRGFGPKEPPRVPPGSTL